MIGPFDRLRDREYFYGPFDRLRDREVVNSVSELVELKRDREVVGPFDRLRDLGIFMGPSTGSGTGRFLNRSVSLSN